MATEGLFSVQNAPSAPAATPAASEQSQPVHSVLNPRPKESEETSLENATVAAGGENPEAPKSQQQTKPPVPLSTDHPLSGAIVSSEPGAALDIQKKDLVAANPEPRTGEKRDFDSTVVADSAPAPPPVPAPAPAPVSDAPTPATSAPAPIPKATTASTSIAPPAPAPASAALEDPAPVPAIVPAPAPASNEREKPHPQESDEPETKKQKIEQETFKDANGSVPTDSTADGNGTQKASRSKKEKVKEAVKKAIPTDGIGSRTRSRTKPN